ncbi:MAG TPA: lysylphosphatidylglycerol synthase transmembrane domain-containing protein [Gemmatimonadota bacterium]
MSGPAAGELPPRGTEAVEPPPRRKRWPTLLRLGFGLALLAVAVRSADLHAVGAMLAGLRPLTALAAFALFACDRSLMAYKWDVLLRARGLGVGFATALRLYLVGGLVGAVTPGGIAGEVYRVVALGERGKAAVASTVVVERLLGMVVMGLFTLATIPAAAGYFGLGSKAVIWTALVLVGLSLAAVLAPLRPGVAEVASRAIPGLRRGRMAARLERFFAVYRQAGAHSGTAVFLLLTVLDVLVMIGVDFAAARALGIQAPWQFFLLTTPTIQFLGRLPITFAGLGVLEGLYLVALRQAGFPPEAGVAFGLFRRVIPLCVANLPAALMLWLRPFPSLSSRGSSR